MKFLSQTYLFDRCNREDWENKGRPESYSRALEQAKEILKTYIPEPLDETAVKQIRTIVEEAEKEVSFR
jgi:trimethylamine:corrinoid methyltransferase-like protein